MSGEKASVNSDSVSKEKPAQKTDTDTNIIPDSEYKPFKSERIEILLEAGMKKEAAAELSAIARKTTDSDELISVSLKLQECGGIQGGIDSALKAAIQRSCAQYFVSACPLAYCKGCI